MRQPRAAIWRGAAAASAGAEREIAQVGPRDRVFISWRLLSLIIVLALSLVLLVFFVGDTFYVRSVAVGGLRYLTKEEIFSVTGIANMHLFWVDPPTVRENLLRFSTIADAQVQVGWPPNMVQIVVEERQPALVWEQAGVATWIDLQGRVMSQRADIPDLVRVQADPVFNEVLSPNGPAIDADIVTGALQLRQLVPVVPAFRYHPENGLGYNDGRGWEAWFGVGADMPQKMLVYEALVNNLATRGIVVSEINLATAPYYVPLSGR